MRKCLRLTALCTALLFCVALGACTFYDVLGIDTHDYAAEEKIADLPLDGEIARTVTEQIPLMVQGTPYLTPFSTPAQAASLYRDSILCCILAGNYAKYNANTELIEAAKAYYPAYEIQTLIPAVDFESTVYRCFGGTASVDNASTKLFTYLAKVDAYVSVGIGVDTDAEITLTALYETENTYVCIFYNTMNGVRSDTYRLLLMKREDGSFYMKSLLVEP